MILSEDDCWRAVSTRDKRADGTFVFAVRTTGIYCRPGCGSRLPRRENVELHDTTDEAEAAGFRACKRCRPKGPSRAQMNSQAVAAACDLIEQAEDIPSLAELATAAGLSPYHFHRIFREVTGLTPRAYAAMHRADAARRELQEASSVTDAIYGAGFAAPSRFYATSGEMLGMHPVTYRRGGAGEVIRFAVGACSLGSVLGAATDKGVCAILLGDDPQQLVQDLQDRFPQADLIGDDGKFADTLSVIAGLVDSPAASVHLPLDIRGTVFQRRVWQLLREIPPGQTHSYAEIAGRLGQPAATRAVARACAANLLAVAIPCHRVVRSDGSLSGYRWGVERKRELLAREEQAA